MYLALYLLCDAAIAACPFRFCCLRNLCSYEICNLRLHVHATQSHDFRLNCSKCLLTSLQSYASRVSMLRGNPLRTHSDELAVIRYVDSQLTRELALDGRLSCDFQVCRVQKVV